MIIGIEEEDETYEEEEEEEEGEEEEDDEEEEEEKDRFVMGVRVMVVKGVDIRFPLLSV